MSKAFQRKLENLESQLLASRSVGVHDWAANELKALSSLIRSTAENTDPNSLPDLTMSSFLSRSDNCSPPIIDSVLVSDESDFEPSDRGPPPDLVLQEAKGSSKNQPLPVPKQSVPPLTLFSTEYDPINISLSEEEIDYAKNGFVEFLKQREQQWEEMRDSVLKKNLRHEGNISDHFPEPIAVQPKSVDNTPIIRSAITSTCLPGDAFKYQRDEIFSILKNKNSRQVILFSASNQFSGLYSVSHQIAHRVFSLPDTSTPHQIVPGIVHRRFRYTYSSGFVEVGNRFQIDEFWTNIDAVTIKT